MGAYTVKFNRKTALAIVIAAAVIIAGVVILASHAGSGAKSPGVGSNAGRMAYLLNLGWVVDETPTEQRSIVLPREFDEIYCKYNELQQEQGFDLLPYAGLEVEFFSYRVLNYPGTEDEVIANLIILNNEVIGGDIHSTAIDGFIHGIK